MAWPVKPRATPMAVLAVVVCCCLTTVWAVGSVANPGMAVRALSLADRIVTCTYNVTMGTFEGDLLWQSGNTVRRCHLSVVAIHLQLTW